MQYHTTSAMVAAGVCQNCWSERLALEVSSRQAAFWIRISVDSHEFGADFLQMDLRMLSNVIKCYTCRVYDFHTIPCGFVERLK